MKRCVAAVVDDDVEGRHYLEYLLERRFIALIADEDPDSAGIHVGEVVDVEPTAQCSREVIPPYLERRTERRNLRPVGGIVSKTDLQQGEPAPFPASKEPLGHFGVAMALEVCGALVGLVRVRRVGQTLEGGGCSCRSGAYDSGAASAQI
jgi:hypothetical protein